MSEVSFSALLTAYNLDSGRLPDKQNNVTMSFVVNSSDISDLVLFLSGRVDRMPSPEKSGTFTLSWQHHDSS